MGSQLWNLVYHVISLDISSKYSPDICTDICKWDYRSVYNSGEFDLIVASPPCTEYSQEKQPNPESSYQNTKVFEKTASKSVIRFGTDASKALVPSLILAGLVPR